MLHRKLPYAYIYLSQTPLYGSSTLRKPGKLLQQKAGERINYDEEEEEGVETWLSWHTTSIIIKN